MSDWKKNNANSIPYSQAVTHPSTNGTRRSLTSGSWRDRVRSTWYGRWRQLLSFNTCNSTWANIQTERNGRLNTRSRTLTTWVFSHEDLILNFYKGTARTQSPTTKNFTPELPTFGVVADVSPTAVQWKGLDPGLPPSWSRKTLSQVSMISTGLRPAFEHRVFTSYVSWSETIK